MSLLSPPTPPSFSSFPTQSPSLYPSSPSTHSRPAVRSDAAPSPTTRRTAASWSPPRLHAGTGHRAPNPAHPRRPPTAATLKWSSSTSTAPAPGGPGGQVRQGHKQDQVCALLHGCRGRPVRLGVAGLPPHALYPDKALGSRGRNFWITRTLLGSLFI